MLCEHLVTHAKGLYQQYNTRALRNNLILLMIIDHYLIWTNQIARLDCIDICQVLMHSMQKQLIQANRVVHG